MSRGLKFRIYEVEGLYYPCSENKGADQLRGYREADLRLCFRICKKPAQMSQTVSQKSNPCLICLGKKLNRLSSSFMCKSWENACIGNMALILIERVLRLFISMAFGHYEDG